MKLSQSVTYAVHAALRLAADENQAPVSCSRIAERGNMPERFLLQILRELAKQGILQSTRGGSGGFMLERDPEDISLLDVIEAVDGPLPAGMPINVTFPEQSALRLRKTLQEVNDATRRQLAVVKLTHLMDAPVRAGFVVGTA